MEPFTIEAPGLAAGLGIPRHAILQHRAGLINHPLLIGLPAPIMTRPRLVWLRADIEAWIESRRTFRFDQAAPAEACAATPRKRGRPRKQLARQPMQEGGEQ